MELVSRKVERRRRHPVKKGENMNRPLSVKLSALADAELILDALMLDAANICGIPAKEIFDGGRPRTPTHHQARLEVTRRLCLTVPALSNSQIGKLCSMNVKSAERMREKIATLEVQGREWRL
jgi:hypothetical protein